MADLCLVSRERLLVARILSSLDIVIDIYLRFRKVSKVNRFRNIMSSVASESKPTKHPQTVHGPSDADCTQKQQEPPEVTSIPVYWLP